MKIETLPEVKFYGSKQLDRLVDLLSKVNPTKAWTQESETALDVEQTTHRLGGVPIFKKENFEGDLVTTDLR